MFGVYLSFDRLHITLGEFRHMDYSNIQIWNETFPINPVLKRRLLQKQLIQRTS